MKHLALFAAVLFAAACLAAAEPAPAGPAGKIRALVLVGGHGYDTKAFPDIFAGHDDISVDIRPSAPKGKPGPFADITDFPYDTIVLYNFRQKLTPAERKNFLALLDRGVGLLVMHHAIVAYPDWPLWEKIIGAKYYLKPTVRDGVTYVRSVWKHGVDIPVHIADPDHPVTRGMKDFTIHDETYGKWTYFPGSRVLMTTTCPHNVKQMVWVKTFGRARVMYSQFGHDKQAYVNKNFRRLVAQGIRWTAGRLNEPKAPAGKKAR